MRGGTLFSGIGAPECAAPWIDWRWCAEIEAFPSAVHAARFPSVPNLGDVTKVDWDAVEPVDVLVAGSPCQSFSVAGKRLGLDDPRGNLALVTIDVARRVRARWLVFENVPGLLSSAGGWDFGSFLGTLAEHGFDAVWRVLDAQFFGVAQRRRRLFLVASVGGWANPAPVLLEPDSLRGNPPPRREAGEGSAADVVPSLTASGRGVERTGESRGQDPVVVASTGQVSHCLNAGGMGRQDYETETLVTHSLRGEGFDASEDGTGRGTPLVPMAFGWQNSASQGDSVNEHITPTLDKSKTPAVAIQERAVSENLESGPQGKGYQEGIAYTLEARSQVQSVAAATAVRRLTPTECERLQGFPDGWTAITYRNKPAADGPRYKALGNSMAVPVMEWILNRLRVVDEAARQKEAA